MATEDIKDINMHGNRIRNRENVEEILMKIKLDLAYCSEKVLNLDILLMHVSNKAIEHEAMEHVETGDEFASSEFLEKFFEFDILCEFLDSGVKELDDFITYLGKEILDVHQNFLDGHLEFPSHVTEKKLFEAEESLKQSQDQVSEIRLQLIMFRKNFKFGNIEAVSSEDTQFSTLHDKWMTQAINPQRHALQMLEKSLARELDLDKNLSDARQNEEELKLKLHYALNDIYCMQEEMEAVLEQLFEAEISAEVFTGISKDLASKLEFAHINLNGAKSQEIVRATSEHLDKFVQDLDGLKNMLEEAEYKSMAAKTQGLHLRETVNQLEMKMIESGTPSQLFKVPSFTGEEQQKVLDDELVDLEGIIANLNKKLMKTENNADNAEGKCKSLIEINAELTRELASLKENGTEKEALERQLEESSSQLEHAKASVEAIEEQRSMLYSALNDMGNLIEDLKTKVSKAEERAESAEAKCTSLAKTNSELGKELEFLRGKLKSLEMSFQEANNAKISDAKEISARTKTITDLVMKLALERERLRRQISALQKEKKIILEKYEKDCIKSLPKNDRYRKEFNSQISLEKATTESSTTHFQVKKSSADQHEFEGIEMQTASFAEDSSADSKSMPVRTIEAGQIRCRHIAFAILVLLVSAIVMHFSQSEKWSF